MPCVTQRLEVRLHPCRQIDQHPPLALLIVSSAIDRIDVDRINAEALGEDHEAWRVHGRLGRVLSHEMISPIAQAGPVPLRFQVVSPVGSDDGIDDLATEQAFPPG